MKKARRQKGFPSIHGLNYLFRMHRPLLTILFVTCLSLHAEPKGKLLFEDDFNRDEPNPEKEMVGNGWGTNSRTRAKGQKQVDLDQGAMHITMAKVADHGVSVTQDIAFKDAVIQMRFKLGDKDDLGINIADMNEKSVHAGHICVARIRPFQVELTDLKTGNMKLEHREARKANKATPEMKKLLATKTKRFKNKLSLDSWHDLEVRIQGHVMTVLIDGSEIGSFESEGIDHATKSRIRLSVNKEAWVDDVKVWKL